MIKMKKEVSMKKAKIASLVAVAALAAAGLFGLKANNADAAETIVIGAGKKIEIRQEIHSNGAEKFTGRFNYVVEEIDGLNAVSNLPTTYIELNNSSFIDDTITSTIDLSFANTRVIAQPGQYKMKLSCVSTVENFPCTASYYTFYINVENVLDSNRVPTGEFATSIIALRKVENGREYSSKLEYAYFYSEEELPPEPVYSYLTLKNTVEGDLASEDDVFKYVIMVDGPEDARYNIDSPEGDYEFDGETVTSATEINGGSTAIIYLRHNEVAIIGRERTSGTAVLPNLIASTSLLALGENDTTPAGQILVGTAYSYKEIPDVKEYKTWIDSKDAGERTEISKMVADDPNDNHTLYINSRTKPTIPEKVKEFVNTGLKTKNGAFAVLGAGAAIVILIILLQRKKKTNK